MKYQEYKPIESLEKYVKCYYSLEYEQDTIVVDQAFATGCIEVMFTLHGQPWETNVMGSFTKTAPVGLWGQVLQPLVFRIPGYSKVFGIRFYPATAALFLREDISQFSDRVMDLTSIIGNTIDGLHDQLQHAESTEQQVQLMDLYLLRNIKYESKITPKVALVQQVIKELSHANFVDTIEDVAVRYGITPRYLQKVFQQYSGLTPKCYSKINRFQNSLVLLGQDQQSLTDIAYACGYFDQSHFIREFKSFTGFVPSLFNGLSTSAILASPNK